MAFYILTYDDKSPIVYGPYKTNEDAFRKQSSFAERGEIYDLPTTNRARAIRMIKAQSDTGLVRYKKGKVDGVESSTSI